MRPSAVTCQHSCKKDLHLCKRQEALQADLPDGHVTATACHMSTGDYVWPGVGLRIVACLAALGRAGRREAAGAVTNPNLEVAQPLCIFCIVVAIPYGDLPNRHAACHLDADPVIIAIFGGAERRGCAGRVVINAVLRWPFTDPIHRFHRCTL